MKIAMALIIGNVSKREYRKSFQFPATIEISEEIRDATLQNSDCKKALPNAVMAQNNKTKELAMPA